MTTAAVEVEVAHTALNLARVFTSGGRLAVAAPGRPDHALHVAVEFVHPAITGAQSLPAFACEPDDVTYRVLPTDALLIMSPTRHSADHELSTRWSERPYHASAELEPTAATRGIHQSRLGLSA